MVALRKIAAYGISRKKENLVYLCNGVRVFTKHIQDNLTHGHIWMEDGIDWRTRPNPPIFIVERLGCHRGKYFDSVIHLLFSIEPIPTQVNFKLTANTK